MKTFEHGGDVASFARVCGCEIDEVIDLSSNINIVKPSMDIDFNTLEIAPYPNYDILYKSIASYYGVKTDEIELFNGGSSAIFSLFAYIKNMMQKTSHVSIYSPAYLEYKKAAEIYGYTLNNINRYENIDAKIKEHSLVIFVNPSTPDGLHYNLENLLQKWTDKNCTILIDESFLEFTEHTSVSNHIKNYDKLFILKSMTKFFGAAGIRIGVLISHAKHIASLKKNEPAWKISQFDSHYIQEVLKDKTLYSRTQKELSKNKALLINILENSSYVKSISNTEANYLLLTLKNIDAKTFQNLLIPFKILIRDCSNFDGLDNRHVRIAIKDKHSIQKLQVALHA